MAILVSLSYGRIFVSILVLRAMLVRVNLIWHSKKQCKKISGNHFIWHKEIINICVGIILY